MKEQIEKLIRKREEEIQLYKIMIEKGGLSEVLLKVKIRMCKRFIADLKNLNEAIVHEPPSGDVD